MGTLSTKGGPQMLKRFGSVALTVFTIAVGCGGDDSGGGGGNKGGTSGSGGAAKGGAVGHGGVTSNGGTASGGASGGFPPADAGAGAVGEGGAEPRGGSGGVGEGGTNEGGALSGGRSSSGGTDGGATTGGGGTSGGGSPNGGGGTTGGTAGNTATGGGGMANAGTAGMGTTGGMGSGTGGKASLSLNMSAPASTLALDACGSTPAVIPDVPAGTYDLELTTSNLSKGTVSDPNDQEFPSFDDYVIVNLPLPAGDPNEKQRFFMLHGVSDSVSVTLPATGSIKLYFIDGDAVNNSGQAKVTLKPAGTQATVDATTNVIAWRTTCTTSAPATVSVSNAMQRVTLVSSTFSSGNQMQDPFVLLRVSNEMQVNDHRFVILNGIGSSYTFTPYANNTLRAWFISATGGGTGAAQLKIEEQ